jgi:hypothetical protein
MQPKCTLLMFLLFTVMGITVLQGQSLLIKTKDGTVTTKSLSTLKMVTFSNNNLLMNYLSEPTEIYNLSTISKLYFKSALTGIENGELNIESTILSIYPNPVNNVIYIQNAPGGISTVFIYRMDGVMVLQSQVSEENKCIQVGILAKGIYLLKINNQVVKFIKQ